MNKTTIILTTTVNVHHYMIATKDVQHIAKDERLFIYIRSIKQWLEKTNFNIIVVDNGNHSYTELQEEAERYKERFEILYYDEKNLTDTNYLINNHTKGIHELYSINYAFENSKLIKDSNFIIKITGRYFLPHLEDYLQSFDLNTIDCIRQNNPDFCELVGCHKKIFYKIFNRYVINNDNVHEYNVETLYKSRIAWFNNIINLPAMAIEPPTTSGYLMLRHFL